MKVTKIVIFISVFLLLSIVSVQAFSSYSQSSQQFDTSLTEEEGTIYSNPKKIYITQISTISSKLSRNPSLWVQSLYYYHITRLYLPDLPYNYLLDEDGTIYQGKSGGIGANIQVEDLNNAIVIGYLSNNPVLTTTAESSLKEMIDTFTYDWGISTLKAISLKVEPQQNAASLIKVGDASSEFITSIKRTITEWKPNNQEHLKYKAKLESIEYPRESVIGGRIAVRVKFTNNNDFVWFTDTDPIYLSVKNNKESSMAINQVWASFSKPLSISDKHIKPGESFEVVFEMEAKVLMGEVNETFVLQKFEDQPFEGSEFEVNFTVVKGDNKLVQVNSPEFGFVNIRECKWASCKVIDSPKDGTVFILLGEEDGWYKIKYGPEKEGWVVSRYLKKI